MADYGDGTCGGGETASASPEASQSTATPAPDNTPAPTAETAPASYPEPQASGAGSAAAATSPHAGMYDEQGEGGNASAGPPPPAEDPNSTGAKSDGPAEGDDNKSAAEQEEDASAAADKADAAAAKDSTNATGAETDPGVNGAGPPGGGDPVDAGAPEPADAGAKDDGTGPGDVSGTPEPAPETPARDLGDVDNPDFVCNPDYKAPDPEPPRNPKATAAEERGAAEAAKDPLDVCMSDEQKGKRIQDDAMRAINKEYRDGTTDQAPNRDCEPVNFDTPEGRQAALNRETQDNPGDKKSADECGPASVIAGAIQAGGEDGVRSVAQGTVTYDKDGNPDPESQKIQDMLDDPNHQWTRGDLHAIQSKMYQQMRDSEDAKEGDEGGVKNDTVRNYIDNNPDLAQMYKDHGVEVDSINNGSTDNPNGHFVMTQRDPNNQYAAPSMVYDPYSRKDGNQVITDPKMINNYNVATTGKIRPDPAAAQQQ
jgi:hypothetical protein